MLPLSSPDSTPARRPPADFDIRTRVDGWKEIAAHLRRGERTVKRWEAGRGLPIHRVPGGGRASVHAYKDELDEWMLSYRLSDSEAIEDSLQSSPNRWSATDISPSEPPAQLASLTPSKPRQPFTPWLRWPLVASVVILAAAAAGAAYRVHAAKTHRKLEAVSASTTAESAIARDLYLKGRFEWSERTPDSLNRALDDFTQSIVHDPSNAATYAGLADTYVLLREYSRVPDDDSYTRAIAAAQKAVALDDSLAEAHRSLGFAEIWGRWNFRDGERELRRAIELDPRDALSHLWFATAMKSPEWYPIVRREFDLAQQLDPAAAVTLANKSIWLYETGHHEEGLEMAHRVAQAQPGFVAPHRYLAHMFWYQRDYPGFLKENRIAARLQQDDVLTLTTAAAAAGFKEGGEQGLLHALYTSRKKLFAEGKIAGEPVAEVSLRLGKKDEALDLLQDDYDHHRSAFLGILTMPDLIALRGNPRYEALRKHLDFPTPDPTFDLLPLAHPTPH